MVCKWTEWCGLYPIVKKEYQEIVCHNKGGDPLYPNYQSCHHYLLIKLINELEEQKIKNGDANQELEPEVDLENAIREKNKYEIVKEAIRLYEIVVNESDEKRKTYEQLKSHLESTIIFDIREVKEALLRLEKRL